MEDFSKRLYEILKKACESCRADTISLSGGLDSTILAYYLKKKNPKAVVIIAKDFESADLTYSQLASKELDLPLSIINVDTSEILESITGTISILKNFNDIEIRNNLVMYLAIKWAKDNHFKSMVTGDGADELFAGYRFLVKKDPNQLNQEIQRITSIMHFPTQKIGEAMGIKVESPFLDESVIEYAKSIPGNLKIKHEKNKKYGKWILRKSFEEKIPHKIAWREKSAMQDGAGTQGLTHLFENLINDKIYTEKKRKIEKEHGIKIRSKESLHYFEVYNNICGKIENTRTDKPSCPYCNFNSENSKFCRMCGAFPI